MLCDEALFGIEIRLLFAALPEGMDELLPVVGPLLLPPTDDSCCGIEELVAIRDDDDPEEEEPAFVGSFVVPPKCVAAGPGW